MSEENLEKKISSILQSYLNYNNMTEKIIHDIILINDQFTNFNSLNNTYEFVDYNDILRMSQFYSSALADIQTVKSNISGVLIALANFYKEISGKDFFENTTNEFLENLSKHMKSQSDSDNENRFVKLIDPENNSMLNNAINFLGKMMEESDHDREHCGEEGEEEENSEEEEDSDKSKD